jgi:ectoine hydroxylase-related dioxygenase (phytanoyl-CoA dioxygenase family)
MSGYAPLRTLTEVEIEAFEQNGFVVLPQVLDPAWLEPLTGACERIVTMPDTVDVTAEAVRLEMPSTATGLFGAKSYDEKLQSRGRFFVHFNTSRQEQSVLDFVLRGAVGGIAASVMRSASARFVDDILFVKEPGAAEETEWHDDDGGGVMMGAQRCSLWISLGDVSEAMGPLRFLRGSHVRFAGWRTQGLKANDLIAANRADVVTCPLRVGDVVAHHPATIHGSSGNRGLSLRRSWALRFAGEGMRFALPALRENEREWYQLNDGESLDGPRFPLAWPRPL